MWGNLPKPKYEGEEMYWEYFPLGEYKVCVHLKAKYHRACVGLVWVDINNNPRS